MKAHVFTDSGVRAVMPRNAIGQHITRPKARTRTKAPSAPPAPPPKLNPRTIANPVMIRMLQAIRTPSAVIRPLMTAERAIGSERNRSITPRWKSAFSASAVVNGRKQTLWTRIPGRANCR